jgi:hypothetical protein
VRGQSHGPNLHEATVVTSPKRPCKLPRAVDGDEHKRERSRAWRQAKRWAFAVVPAVGLLELGAHVVQTNSVVPEADWRAARDYVGSHAKTEDLVVFAPTWADPVGRSRFGSAIATLEREARADETRFPRALEVSIRGAHLPALEGWRRADRQRFGRVTVTTWENPAAAQVLDDLVSMVAEQRVRVSRVDAGRESECSFQRGSPQSGGLGFGPAIPGDRFVCAGGAFVVPSVVADLDYRPHRCVYAPPPGGNSLVRVRFVGVRLGHALHGHHALYVEAERNRTGAPVTITFKAGDLALGSVVHNDGDGWKPFEFDTSALAGQRGDVIADIGSPSGDRRMYCFEADTR